MVTTRRSILSQVEDSSPSRDNSPAVNGKRKTVSSVTELTFEPTPKRRRGQAKKEAESEVSAPQPNGVKKRPYKILEAVEIRSSGSNTRESSILTPTTNPEEISKKISLRPKTAHVRFGSEEPEHELSGVEEIAPRDEENVPQQEMDDDDSDDEAPEAISNTKQLQGLKEAERKREEARQKQDQLKKQKRREHEKRLKLQAKPKPSLEQFITPIKPKSAPKQEEILSESSVTLQGSEVKAPGSSSFLPASLPKLLPDEILFAKPSARPPTPPRMIDRGSVVLERSTHIFRPVNVVDTKPKDIKLGGTSIRVFEDSSNTASCNGFNNSLPPRASKQGRTVRENWMTGNRKGGGAINGTLRRTTGGSSGFVRK